MFTYMLYEAERPRTLSEQRELNTINGEMAVAFGRPFRWLRSTWHAAGSAARRQPRTDEQPRLKAGAFPSESTVPQARCN